MLNVALPHIYICSITYIDMYNKNIKHYSSNIIRTLPCAASPLPSQ